MLTRIRLHDLRRPLRATNRPESFRSLIPEYHHIVKHRPSHDRYKELPPLSQGGLDGEAFDPVEQQGGNKEQAFGVYHTPKDFVRLAETLNHPFDDSFAIRRPD